MSKRVDEIGEFNLIDRITRFLPSTPMVLEGVGDDCAVLRVFDHHLLVSCDFSVEGTHFTRDTAQPEDIGWKVAAASLSDIAAMGGSPLFSLVSLSCPGSLEVAYLEKLYQGLSNLLSRFGVVVVGGDTTRSEALIGIDVTVIGEASGNRFLRRRGAQVGDVLAITGRPGMSGAGLHALQHGHEAPALTAAHLRPKPRILEGLWLSTRPNAHAMLDVSDGLFQDAGHLARPGHLGIDIHPKSLPIAPELTEYAEAHGLDPIRLALTGGEDFELLFALDANTSEETLDAFRQEFRTPITVIGAFTDEWTGVRLAGEEAEAGGFDQFLSGLSD
jgi:thiamine-monophosphate kinase